MKERKYEINRYALYDYQGIEEHIGKFFMSSFVMIVYAIAPTAIPLDIE